MNKKSFSIHLPTVKRFNITPFGNRKKFSIYLNNESRFSLVIVGFNLVEKYVLKPTMYFRTQMTPKLISKITTGISLGTHVLTLAVRQLLSISVNLAQSVSLSQTLRQQLKVSMPISQTFGVAMNAVVATPFTLSFSAGMVTLGMNLDSLVYYTLADHDGKTLAEMDGMLLRELDYYILPNSLLEDDGNFLVDDNGDILEG